MPLIFNLQLHNFFTFHFFLKVRMYPRDVEECRKAILKVEVNIGKWIRVDQQGICNYPNKHFLFIIFNVVSNLLTIFPYRSIFCHQLARKRLRFILGSIKLWFGGMVYL